jgi:hypothetical protein
MELNGTDNVPTVVNGQISESKGGKVDTRTAKEVSNYNNESPCKKDHKVLLIGDIHSRHLRVAIGATAPVPALQA